MGLPATIRVKLSSEAAGYVTLTPVVVEEIAFAQLLAEIAGIAGKDAGRIGEILRRGTLVSGATRYRWEGLTLAAAEMESAMALLPEPDPSRAFDRGRCVRAYLVGPGVRVEVTREAAEARRLFHRESFWERLLGAAAEPLYAAYDYRGRADTYRASVTQEQRAAIRAGAALLKYSGLARSVEMAQFDVVEFVVER
jgi:hypothetical protein